MQDAAQHTAEAMAASAASKGMYTGAGITLGVCRYTGNFAAPTYPFPAA